MTSSVGVSFAEGVAAQEAAADPPPPPGPPPPPAEPPKEEAPPEKVTLEETPEAPPKKTELVPEKVTLEETPEPAPVRPRATTPPAARTRPKTRASEPERRREAAPEEVPAVVPEPPEARTEEPETKSKKDDDGDGLLGPFRIGPIVGVGLPGIVSFGGLIKVTRYFGAGINIGLIPAIRVSFYGEAELSYQEYDAYGRIFPFGGMVFVGAGVGYATMSGHVRARYDTTAYQSQVPGLPNPVFIDSEGSVKTLVLTPMIGLLHTFKSGFTFGLDVGAQLPIAPSESHFATTLPPSTPQQVIDQYVTPGNRKVLDTLDTVGRTILPTVNLRIGWLL
jgi:hypothetical protein